MISEALVLFTTFTPFIYPFIYLSSDSSIYKSIPPIKSTILGNEEKFTVIKSFMFKLSIPNKAIFCIESYLVDNSVSNFSSIPRFSLFTSTFSILLLLFLFYLTYY